jgi:hypothetical protein
LLFDSSETAAAKRDQSKRGDDGTFLAWACVFCFMVFNCFVAFESTAFFLCGGCGGVAET